MKNILSIDRAVTTFSVLTIAGSLIPAHGAEVYTSAVEFTSKLVPGSYVEDFTRFGLTYDSLPSPQAFAGGSPTFQYTIATFGASSGDLYVVSPAGFSPSLSLEFSEDNLRITFTSGNVTAVGGTFLMTDYDGGVGAGAVTIALNDGTTTSVNSPGDPNGLFRGFTSTVPITSIEIKGTEDPDSKEYAAVYQLTVGQAVPEPGTLALGTIGLAALLMRRTRRQS